MSISEWKAREKEQRHNDIVDAAEKLFFAKGFDAVSMDDIAKEIGLNKATLYRYFMSKEALFFAVVLRGVRIHHELLKAGVKASGTGMERLSAIGTINHDFFRQYPDYHRLLNYYISGRFDLCKLVKTEDEVIVPTEEYRKLLQLGESMEGTVAREVTRLGKAGVPASEYQRWVKLAEVTESEVAREISRLRWEMFDLSRAAVKAGQEDGSIYSGIGPSEIAVLLSILSTGLVNISPDYQSLIDYLKIDREELFADSRKFVRQAISTDDPRGH